MRNTAPRLVRRRYRTLWFGQRASPVAEASSIDTGLAPFSGRPSACPAQTRLHAGRDPTLDGWTAART